MGLISNGSTIFDNGSMASGFGGSLVFLSKQTASASASIEFTSGIDSTYKEYLFTFNNCHPSNNAVSFQFQGSINGGSSYGVTITSTMFEAYHTEAGASGRLIYRTIGDLAQSTSFQELSGVADGIKNDNDASCSGYIHIFNPSDTTFVKHWIANFNNLTASDATYNIYSAGYFNDTNDIDAFKFQMSSGNIDSGDICLYGIA
jgi:hypothetical protein